MRRKVIVLEYAGVVEAVAGGVETGGVTGTLKDDGYGACIASGYRGKAARHASAA